MKIGEVRVAEDSDFALLKVIILFIVICDHHPLYHCDHHRTKLRKGKSAPQKMDTF